MWEVSEESEEEEGEGALELLPLALKSELLSCRAEPPSPLNSGGELITPVGWETAESQGGVEGAEIHHRRGE